MRLRRARDQDPERDEDAPLKADPGEQAGEAGPPAPDADGLSLTFSLRVDEPRVGDDEPT